MAKKPMLGNHQRSWIWGWNVVVETLRAGRWKPYELHMSDDAFALREDLQPLAKERDVPIHRATADRLTQLCGADEHQGVIAKMPPFPYEEAETIRAAASRDPLFLLTDHLQDPFNLGAILRCAQAFGVEGIFLPNRDQVAVTSQVARSSAGAVNHLRIARIEEWLPFVDRLVADGIRLVAASEHASLPLHKTRFTGPTALVIGNEGSGIKPELLDRCSDSVAIPIAGGVGSLNAAVAAGIMLYEAARQRGFLFQS